MELDLETTGGKAAVGAGAVTAIGAFMPWITAGIISVSGLQGDGVFTLLFGLAAVGVALVRGWEGLDQAVVGASVSSPS